MRPDAIQIPSDATGTVVVASPDQTTFTLTLKKVTQNGTDGSVTIKNGKVTASTKPT